MKRIVAAVLILGACILPVSPQTSDKPDFSGTWKLESQGSTEVFTFKHDATNLAVIMNIVDPVGKRTVEVRGIMDGKPHNQTCLGHGCTLTAEWFGKSLIWDIRRESDQGIFANRRIMTLTGPNSIHTVRTRLSPRPEQTWDETWTRVSDK